MLHPIKPVLDLLIIMRGVWSRFGGLCKCNQQNHVNPWTSISRTNSTIINQWTAAPPIQRVRMPVHLIKFALQIMHENFGECRNWKTAHNKIKLSVKIALLRCCYLGLTEQRLNTHCFFSARTATWLSLQQWPVICLQLFQCLSYLRREVSNPSSHLHSSSLNWGVRRCRQGTPELSCPYLPAYCFFPQLQWELIESLPGSVRDFTRHMKRNSSVPRDLPSFQNEGLSIRLASQLK